MCDMKSFRFSFFEKLMPLLLIVLFLSSCSQKSNEQPPTKQIIDETLLTQVSGTWFQEDGSTYDITLGSDHQTLFFDNKELTINEANGDSIHAETEEEKPWQYTFILTEDHLTVYPSFSVPKDSSGGDLAPINLQRKNFLSIDYTNDTQAEKQYREGLKQIYELYEKKEPFFLTLTRYTTEGDPIIEMLNFNGQFIYYTHDNQEDSFGDPEFLSFTYTSMNYRDSDNTYVLLGGQEKDAFDIVFD